MSQTLKLFGFKWPWCPFKPVALWPEVPKSSNSKVIFRTKNISFARAVGCTAWKRVTWDAPYNPPTGGVVFNTVHWPQTSIDVLTHTGSASLAQYYLTSEFKRKSCIQGSRCYRTTWCKVLNSYKLLLNNKVLISIIQFKTVIEHFLSKLNWSSTHDCNVVHFYSI